MSSQIYLRVLEVDDRETLASPRAGSPNLSSSSGSGEWVKEKSELCKKFVERGSCPYGEKCKFAHGSHELRQNHGQNAKYKTKECLTFFNGCHCKYGDRCNFLHESSSFLPSFSTALHEYPHLLFGDWIKSSPSKLAHLSHIC